MIRGLVLILGLLLGLGAAIALGGRLSHLRLLVPGSLPSWSAGLIDNAGFGSGQGRILGADLRWRFTGFDVRGPHWSAGLNGPDWQVQGVAHVVGASLRIEDVQGVLPGAMLQDGGTGAVAVETGALLVAMPSGALTEGQLAGQARGLEIAGTPHDGPVQLRFDGNEWSVVP